MAKKEMAEKTKGKQKKFEYLIGPYKSRNDVGQRDFKAQAEFDFNLKSYNELGAQGWEMVALDNAGPGAKAWVIFKREVHEE